MDENADHPHGFYNMKSAKRTKNAAFTFRITRRRYTVRERSGMIHCYAMLPYFREAREDFEEIAAILAK